MAAVNVPVIQGVAGGTPIPVDTGAGGSATGTITSVASSITDVTILAANVLRLGGSVFNESTAILYLACANVTSSATVYTVQIPPNGYFEIPFGYVGVLKGIWAAANGFARITQYTA